MRLAFRNVMAVCAVGIVLFASWVLVVTNGRDPDVYRFAEHPPAGPVALVAFGDSLGFGLCASKGNGFLSRIARDLTASRPGSTFVNRSVPGFTTLTLFHHLGDAPAKADAVVIVVGANDLQTFTWPTVFLDSFRGTLARIHHDYPDVAVVVLGVPDIGARTTLVKPPLKPFYAALTRFYDGIERRAANDHGAAFYDFYTLSHTPAATDPKNVCPDGIHPTDAGHAALAAAVEPLLRETFQF